MVGRARKQRRTRSAPPRVSVFGLGEYYSKLRPHLSSYFKIESLFDVRPFEDLGLDETDRSLFHHIVEDRNLSEIAGEADLCLVLTPHQYHAAHVLELAQADYAVMVEKPMAVTRSELAMLEKAARSSRIYFSSFYVDVRSIALQRFFGRQGEDSFREELFANLPASQLDLSVLGDIQAINGRILETYDVPQATWLRERPYGGVVGDHGEFSVVGGFEASEPLTFLNQSLIRPPGPLDSELRSIHILADRPSSVVPVASAVMGVLGATDQTSVGIETSETLASVRAAVKGELGRFGRELAIDTIEDQVETIELESLNRLHNRGPPFAVGICDPHIG